jgi:hypothetical protein
MGFTQPIQLPEPLVRSYRTVSPLPRKLLPASLHKLLNEHPVQAVCFLLHLPYPRGRWALPTIASYGARTFLSAISLTQRTSGYLQTTNQSIRKDSRYAKIARRTAKISAADTWLLICSATVFLSDHFQLNSLRIADARHRQLNISDNSDPNPFTVLPMSNIFSQRTNG